jgi:predicted RNA-binding Zn-ribbon protein involved in translation (DUF1610 family)
MSEKLYRLYCEMCGFNRYTNGTDITDLVPYARCVVQTGIPKIDPVTKKVVTKKPIALPKQFKCPKCGRLITARKVVEKPKEVMTDENIDSGSETSDAGPEVSPDVAGNP